MHESETLKTAKWPFFFGDAVMLGLAYFIYWQGKLPLTPVELGACVACVALGVWLAIWPYLLEHCATMKSLDNRALGSASEKLQQLGAVAAQISSATNHWNMAQEQAEKTAGVAKEISER